MTTFLADAARVVGGYAWLEERLFETLGVWVQAVPEPEVKLRLAADSHHHAWHASLWRERLPALRELEAEQFVAASGPTVESFLAGLRSSATTIDKLVGVYRVLLPRLVATYQRHLEGGSAVTEGPTIRALRLVLADDLADWRDGELLIQRLLTTPGNVERASAQQARLETLLIDA
ncbi:MAG: hypothetical protein QOF30_1049 [Acidimicrobiaceae bacterium]|jgi:hypothetical protein|nr:hypothetical protein [Acidimicrobiaceae bacterium]